VPQTIYDPNWNGLAIKRETSCDHGFKLRKFVAFEGTNTEKRFLGCTKEDWMIYIAKLMFALCCSFFIS
jgi:hypothetical protein